MTQAIPIPPYPAIIPAATYIRPEILATYENIEECPEPLQGMETKMVFIDSNGNIFHLNGSGSGREGVRLHGLIRGEQHLPIEQVTTESAYQFGATLERTNYLMRKIALQVAIGAEGMNNITYRMCEDRFWTGQDEVNGGWFGVFTRYSGWRWIMVFPDKTEGTAQKRDPVAFNNNLAIWDVNWISPIPYYSKPAVTSKPWIAANAGRPDENGYYHGTIALPNRGDLGSYVEYLVTGGAGPTGTVVVQDNNSQRYVGLPEMFDSDGQVLCDTDPTHRTMVGENDPMDQEFYDILQSGGLLSFLLGQGTTPAQEAVWLRDYIRFSYVSPPNNVCHYRVASQNPATTITARLTQRYKRSR